MSDNDTLICFFCEQSFPMDQEGSIMMSNYNEEVHACARVCRKGNSLVIFQTCSKRISPHTEQGTVPTPAAAHD